MQMTDKLLDEAYLNPQMHRLTVLHLYNIEELWDNADLVTKLAEQLKMMV